MAATDPTSPDLPDVPYLFRGGRATGLVKFTLPAAAFIGLLASVLVVFPDRAGEFWGLITGYLIPPAGKESIIPAAVASGFEPFLVAIYIAGMDMTLAWFLAWNWSSVLKIPKAGALVERCMASGQAWMGQSALADRSAFLALVLFVFFPLQGSGAFAGVIVGRLIGMPAQRAWVAIMIGALTAAFAWAYAAGAIRGLVLTFGWQLVAQGTVVVIATATMLTLLARRILDHA